MSLMQVLTGQSNEHLIELDRYLVNKAIIDDFLSLKKAAWQAGFVLAIASGFRDFDRQLCIWNAKFNGKIPLLDSKSEPLDAQSLNDSQKIVAILRWSALPGASRHHWGTDLDIFASNLLPSGTKLKLEPWEYLNGHQAPFYTWLKDNLEKHGFFFPYAEDKGGIATEHWHISHFKTAKQYQKGLNIELLKTCIEKTTISGKSTIIEMLLDIYPRFVTNICHPSTELTQYD